MNKKNRINNKTNEQTRKQVNKENKQRNYQTKKNIFYELMNIETNQHPDQVNNLRN